MEPVPKLDRNVRRNNKHKLEHGKLQLGKIKTIFTMKVVRHWKRSLERCGIFTLEYI